jgi:hypothetical protein
MRATSGFNDETVIIQLVREIVVGRTVPVSSDGGLMRRQFGQNFTNY